MQGHADERGHVRGRQGDGRDELCVHLGIEYVAIAEAIRNDG